VSKKQRREKTEKLWLEPECVCGLKQPRFPSFFASSALDLVGCEELELEEGNWK
jgi:hypothetical protein